MKLQNYLYQCNKCKNKFKAPELLGEPYGEFLLRTKTGEIEYLFAIDSSEFLEVGNIVDKFLENTGISELGRAKVLHQLFGITCDLASDGTEYKIGGKPICPKCGSNEMYSWEPIYPVEIVEVDVPHVTHERWNKLSDVEKQSKIEEAVKRVLADKDNLGIL